MSTLASVAFVVGLFVVVGNWFLEVCEAAARRHRGGAR